MEQAKEIIKNVCNKVENYSLILIILCALLTLFQLIISPELKYMTIGGGNPTTQVILFVTTIYLTLTFVGVILGAELINIIAVNRINEEIKNGKRS